MKTCVLGLGVVGLPAAKYALGIGLEVWGYDINPASVKQAKEQGISRATVTWDEIPPVDVYIICVSTTQRNSMPELSPVFDVCQKISQKVLPPSLVSIESTVIPGTCKRIYEDIFGRKINLVHVPHRYWAESSSKHGVKQLRVIGTASSESLKMGLRFYSDILNIPLHVVPSIEIAEMCKISENAYRYVQIAFAEELKMICEKMRLNFDELRKACNTKWNVEILEAREGIGGHCLPKDIKYLESLTWGNTLLEGAQSADKKYREWRSQESQQAKP